MKIVGTHKPTHSKGLTFSAEPNTIKKDDQLSQSFDNNKNNNDQNEIKLQKPKKKNQYVNLEDEEDANNNNNNYDEYRNAYSFFSSNSKEKQEKDEKVVNISHLDMEKDPSNEIIDQMNELHSSSTQPDNKENNPGNIKTLNDINVSSKDSNYKLKIIISILIVILIIAGIFITVQFLKK